MPALATLSPPGGPSQALTYNTNNAALEFQAKLPTPSGLEATYGPGQYTLAVQTVHDGSRNLVLTLPAGNFPNAPHFNNFSTAQVIDPAADFTLTWDRLDGGTTNDFTSFGVMDGTGNVLLQTPQPWQAGALNGTATSAVIPGGTLGASQVYQAQLIFFRVTTRDPVTYPGALGAVAWASQTRLNLSTITPQLRFGLMFRHLVQGGAFNGGTNAEAILPGEVIELNISTREERGPKLRVLSRFKGLIF